MEFCAFKTFDQVPKKNGQIFSLDRKIFDQLKSLKKFDQLIMKVLIN
jgi:hypothetical protein